VSLLEVHDLKVQFATDDGVVKAVDGASFAVERGQTLGIVGESGCGKSVANMSILGLTRSPNTTISGRILLEGRDLNEMSADDLRGVRGREIAMIFQEPMTSLNPVLTIGRQLTEGLEIHLGMDTTASRKRASELLSVVGIPDPTRRLPQYPHQFSGGMRQRMMIAMALACNPSLILADEPTTALDVTIQAQILELLKDLSRRLGVAMLIITHNLGVVARYADRVNVMYAGRIVERATARELYANPRHPYTLGLLKSVPRLDVPRRQRLDPIDGQPPDLTRLPPGCAFGPRCAFRVERCVAEIPPLRAIEPEGHVTACWEAERVIKVREPQPA
jgi:oligopeptide/dipeptide ABC transporter ATP-binding protein